MEVKKYFQGHLCPWCRRRIMELDGHKLTNYVNHLMACPVGQELWRRFESWTKATTRATTRAKRPSSAAQSERPTE